MERRRDEEIGPASLRHVRSEGHVGERAIGARGPRCRGEVGDLGVAREVGTCDVVSGGERRAPVDASHPHGVGIGRRNVRRIRREGRRGDGRSGRDGTGVEGEADLVAVEDAGRLQLPDRVGADVDAQRAGAATGGGVRGGVADHAPAHRLIGVERRGAVGNLRAGLVVISKEAHYERPPM